MPSRPKSRWESAPTPAQPVYLKMGRFGPYVQRAGRGRREKPQNASLLKGMKPEDVDAADGGETACRCRGDLGPNPTNGETVLAYNGRFGPYVKCGEGKTAETRSLPAGVSPLDVTLPQALELLAQPKAQRRGFGASASR